MIKIKGKKILTDQNVKFANPIKDVHTASLPIAGCAWVETSDGVVLIDTLLSTNAASEAFKNINGIIKYIIYTHGHADHVGGAKAFLRDNPEIIANKYLPDRLDKYKFLAPHRSHTRAVQFNTPEIKSNLDYVYPTRTFLGDMNLNLGDKTFELHTARAETDDVCWVYVPELKAAFIGDLIIGGLPNIGNPWKPTRFALDWAKELERIHVLKPENLFCNGAGYFYKGKQALKVLKHNIEAIRSLHDQIVDYINQNVHITEMIHKVQLPPHLKKITYLKPLYSRPEFFVLNVYRWYHGYFDDNPAHLLPRPEKEIMNELYGLIGSPEKIIERVKRLLDNDQAQLALEVLDILIQADPENLDAKHLRIKLLEKLGKEDYCLMSRNAWVYYIDKDKEFIKSRTQ